MKRRLVFVTRALSAALLTFVTIRDQDGLGRRLVFVSAALLAAVVIFAAVRDQGGLGLAYVADLTVDRKGTVAHPGGGEVRVSGTLTCTAGAEAQVNVEASQFVRGQVPVSAFGWSPPFFCSGAVQNWAVTAVSSFALRPGPATVRARAWMYVPPYGHYEEETTARVILHPQRQR